MSFCECLMDKEEAKRQTVPMRNYESPSSVLAYIYNRNAPNQLGLWGKSVRRTGRIALIGL